MEEMEDDWDIEEPELDESDFSIVEDAEDNEDGEDGGDEQLDPFGDGYDSRRGFEDW